MASSAVHLKSIYTGRCDDKAPIVRPATAAAAVRCSSRFTQEDAPIPKLVAAVAVSATTQLLRLFSFFPTIRESASVNDASQWKRSPVEIQDVIDALVVDYDQAYFLTGNFTGSLYSEECYFADPTISFTGRDLYERNLKLLVPFLEEPSLTLVSLVQVYNKPLRSFNGIVNKEGEACSIRAVWQLRTHLKLPWRPFICVDGSTVYDLDEQYRIVKHVESWSISVFEALSQIFRKGADSH